MKKLNKALCFTDIHWGAKSNSSQHNEDCTNFIKWVCSLIKQDPSIDHIMFLGDWHENRSALNLATLNASYDGMCRLNELGLPIYVIIGNHDLYFRHTRELHSLPHFDSLTNVQLIQTPTIINETTYPCLISPYLFENEYHELDEYLKIPIWWGHFEFKGFVITGNNIKMPTGPEVEDYPVSRIFSGHFHKRQQYKHVTYIGNTFPTNFSDAGDNDRGVAVYQYDIDHLEFINWADCPKYMQISLSDALEDNITIHPNTRVKCVVDVVLDYEQTVELKQKMEGQFELREFKFEETAELASLLTTDVDTVDLSEHQLASVNELVVTLINTMTSERINKNKLIRIFNSLNVDFKPAEE